MGVADIREKRRRKPQKRHDVPNYYQDPQKMLDELKPDFVAVCTPNMYHKEWTLKALRSGAHVACEKTARTYRSRRARDVGYGKRMWKNAFFRASVCAGEIICSSQKSWWITVSWGDVYFSDIEFIRRIGIPTWGNVPYEKAQFRRPVLRSRRTSDRFAAVDCR